MTSTATADLFTVQPHAVRCPHTAFRELHATPVAFEPTVGAFVVSRHEDVLAVLRDQAAFSSRQATGPHSATSLAQAIVRGELFADELPGLPRLREVAERRARIAGCPTLINADEPVHLQQRSIVKDAFGPARLTPLRPVIEELVEDLLDDMGAEGDLLQRFCRPLPMFVIADALGVPRAERATFERWSDAFISGVGRAGASAEQALEVLGAIDEFYDYFEARLDEAAQAPRRDLLSDIAASPLSRSEQLQMVSLLLVAGNETTSNLIAGAVIRLAADPALADRLRADDDLLPGFVEEVLRTESPASGMYRTATRDAVVGGTPVPAGSFLFLAYHAANHDPALYDDPEQVVVGRDHARTHLAFGNGAHFCLGARLARTEAHLALRALLRRTTAIALTTPAEDLPYLRSFAHRGPLTLPVRLTAAADRG